MKIRFYIGLWCGKIVKGIMKLLHKKASYMPGYIAIKICPEFLEMVPKAKHIICVTGTDGKTTTANLLADVLIKLGYKVASNRLGSNTNIGVGTAFVDSVSFFGKPKVDAVVLETDEHHTRFVCPKINCEYLLVTNLLRDSLQRNAHPEYVFNKINECKVPNMKVVLNADELCSSELLQKNKRIYYGIGKLKTDLKKPNNIINDNKICPKCDEALIFDYVKYCHIGSAHCPKCGFKTKTADYLVEKINYDKKYITINYKKEKYEFKLINDGLFNIYNQVAIISLLFDLGIQYEDLKQAIDKVEIAKTRFTELEINGVKITKMMAKGNNSLPVSLVFDYIAKKEEDKAIILALDDYDERKSSERIGWIYDTDYEFLKQENIKQILVTGPRYLDHELRLLLAGIDKKKLICMENETEAIKKLKYKNIKTVYLLHDMSSYEMSVEAEQNIIKHIKGEL